MCVYFFGKLYIRRSLKSTCWWWKVNFFGVREWMLLPLTSFSAKNSFLSKGIFHFPRPLSGILFLISMLVVDVSSGSLSDRGRGFDDVSVGKTSLVRWPAVPLSILQERRGFTLLEPIDGMRNENVTWIAFFRLGFFKSVKYIWNWCFFFSCSRDVVFKKLVTSSWPSCAQRYLLPECWAYLSASPSTINKGSDSPWYSIWAFQNIHVAVDAGWDAFLI